MNMLRNSRKVLFLVLSAVLLFTGISHSAGTDELLKLVPADSLFCVQLNNFDYTLGQLDQFLAGTSPMPMGVSMVARMQLAGMLGDPALQGLDTTGSFAVFGTACSKEGAEAKASDIVVTALLPVKDYGQFVNLSANVNEPDANGISKIAAAGMGGPGKAMVAAKAGQFALVGAEKNYAQVLEMAKAISAGNVQSIIKSIDADQLKSAKETPFWAYGDIQQINKAFGPAIAKGLEQMQEDFKKITEMTGQPQMGNTAEMIKVYMDLLKDMLEQGKYASVAIKPEPAVLRIHKTMAAKPDTELAKTLSADATLPKENKLLGYLQDGAMVNFAAKVSGAWMEKLNKFGMSFLSANADSQEEIAQWQQLSQQSIEAMGNLLAISVKVSKGNKPPFAAKYIVEIRDKKKLDEVFAKTEQLMNTGAFAEMYKNMGIQAQFKMVRGVDSYKDVSIDSAKLIFNFKDANSPEAQMLKTMYGDGFEYRMACVDNLFVTGIGGDPNKMIRQMIDTIKTGGVKELSGEVKTAVQLLPQMKDADFAGTVNYVRLMQMVTTFAPVPIPLPFDQIQTSNNMAFAGRVTDGKLVVDIAVPKEHVAELMTGFQMMQQQMMQQQMQQQSQGSKQ